MESILGQLLNPWVLGIGFVVIHAYVRFNTPPTSRSLTTASRSYAAATAYVLATVLLYLVLAMSPELLDYFTGSAGSAIPQDARDLSARFFVALLLTALLPKVPYLSDLDRRLIGLCHSVSYRQPESAVALLDRERQPGGDHGRRQRKSLEGAESEWRRGRGSALQARPGGTLRRSRDRMLRDDAVPGLTGTIATRRRTGATGNFPPPRPDQERAVVEGPVTT